MRTTKITPRWLNRHRACKDGWVRPYHDVLLVRYPKGVPVTLEAALEAHEAGISWLDILWVALHQLRNRQDRRDFIIFTLRQRQPHLAMLFRRAGLNDHARAITSLDWSDLRRAQHILAAARDAAWAAARDAAFREQVEWIADRASLREHREMPA